MATETMPKHPCQGCVYFKVCGCTTRTEPCYGRKTKRERRAEDGNEKRLIDANALKELIFRRSGNMKDTWSYSAVLLAAECQPTVDAVEVVRCKDCKHNVANKAHDPLDATDYTDIVCDYWMTDGNRPDDFCSYGERREGE